MSFGNNWAPSVAKLTRLEQQFQKDKPSKTLKGKGGLTLSPEMAELAAQLGIAPARAAAIVGLQAPERPTGHTGVARQITGGGWDRERDQVESKFDQFKNKISKGPEAILRNMSLVGTHPDIDLNDPYQFSKFSTPGFAEGIQTAHLGNFLQPNKANIVSKIGKAALPVLAGTVLGAATGGTASPIISGMVAGGTRTATDQAIRGGLGAVNLGNVAMGTVAGGITGALPGLTSGLNNPILESTVKGAVESGLNQAGQGRFDLENFLLNAGILGATDYGFNKLIGSTTEPEPTIEELGGPYANVDHDPFSANPLVSNFEKLPPIGDPITNVTGITPRGLPIDIDEGLRLPNIEELGGPYRELGNEYREDPIGSPFEEQPDIDPITDITGIASSGLPVDIDAELYPTPGGGNIGDPPGDIDEDPFLKELGVNLIPIIIGSILEQDPDTEPEGRILPGGNVLSSFLGTGAGKRDPLSDLQIRGLGI